MNTKKIFVIFVHAFVGWALCTASMVIGMATIPFALIFTSTYVTGLLTLRNTKQQTVSFAEHGSK
jgi:hypothetical protein